MNYSCEIEKWRLLASSSVLNEILTKKKIEEEGKGSCRKFKLTTIFKEKNLFYFVVGF